MKLHPQPTVIRRSVAILAGLAWLAGGLQAAPFLYSPGDLVLAFRQAGNASDYVVNIGSAATFSALPANYTIVISNHSPAQLTAAFPSVNGVSWSVAGAVRNTSAFPLQTLWMSAPRSSAPTQSSPWLRKGQFIQGNAASQIDAIGNNAVASSSSQPAGPNNTSTGVVIPVNTDYAITPLLGDGGNYANTFQGDVEATTAPDFEAQPQNLSRTDLYELRPGSSAADTLNTVGRYLGYFELRPDGTLTFSNQSPPPSAPQIESIQTTGGVTTVSFSTENQVTYVLRSTDAAGLKSPRSGWASGATVVGNGSVLSLQATNSAGNQFFVIEARP